MNESILRDYKSELLQMVKRLELIPTEIEKMENYSFEKIYDALEKSQPSLMFYGIYNSGKSSLLNSILGEERASVNDVPETHRVTAYSWNSYTLVDTPGLNGPKEDQKVTLAEIDKHDIIMFVIDDSDNFDSEEITKRIVDILNAKKPCIIVINKKNDSDDRRISHIKAKMQENIEKLYCSSKEYDFVSVNAVSALNARQGGKKLLLKDSNIETLEFLINKKLKSVKGIQMLISPIDLSVNICKEIRKEFSTLGDNEETTRLNQLANKLYYVKEEILQEFDITLQNKMNSYAEQVYNQTVNGGLIQESKYEREIQDLAQSFIHKYEKESQTTVESFKKDWKLELQISKIPQLSEVPVNSKIQKDILDNILDALEDMPIVLPAPWPDTIPVSLPILVKALKIVKELLFGPGKEEIPDVEELNLQQEEIARRRQIALREAKTQIDMAMEQFQKQILYSFTEQIGKIYSASVEHIDKARDERIKRDQLIMHKIDALTLIESELNQLRRDITSS